MWLLVVGATDVWAAGTPADSAWVRDTGGVLYLTPPTKFETGDTGDSADSGGSGESGGSGSAPDTDPPDTDVPDTDTDGGTDPDTDDGGVDDDDDDDDDDDEGSDVGCCGTGGTESSAILGVGLALAVVLGRRRIDSPASPSGKASRD